LVGFVRIPESEQEIIDSLGTAMSEDQTDKAQEMPEVATHVLQFMVRGLTSGVVYPLAYYSCSSMKADELYKIFWRTVKRLELCGIRVLLSISDGAGVNRSFIKLCCSAD